MSEYPTIYVPFSKKNSTVVFQKSGVLKQSQAAGNHKQLCVLGIVQLSTTEKKCEI